YKTLSNEKIKEPGKIARCLSSTPHFINVISIQVLAVKCKYKIDYFHFFMNILFFRRKSQGQLA
ncbi:MAG: hypothetical protein ACYSUX_11045, partial [Planctomycetota bacterium]